MTHFIQKYGNPRYCSDEYKNFSTYFRSHYAIEWLGPIFTTLHDYYSGKCKFISSDVHRNCITYISNCTEMSPSYKVSVRFSHIMSTSVMTSSSLASFVQVIKPHLDFVLFEVIYPSLCLKPSDLESFSCDPQAFLSLVSLQNNC